MFKAEGATISKASAVAIRLIYLLWMDIVLQIDLHWNTSTKSCIMKRNSDQISQYNS